MAVFETFTLLFKADSTQLKKEVDDVKKKTGETGDTFKNVEEQTKKTDVAFLGLAKSLAGVAAAYFSIGAVLGGFSTAISSVSELALVSKELGLSTEVLDAWGKALKNFGVAPEEFANTVRTLKVLFNTTPERVVELLPEIGDTIKRLGPIEGPRYAQEELGIPAGITAFIGRGSAVYEKEIDRQKELGLVSEEDVKVAQAFNKSTGEFNDSLNELYRAVAKDLLPVLTDLVSVLTTIVEALSFFKKSDISVGEILDPNNQLETIKDLFEKEDYPGKIKGLLGDKLFEYLTTPYVEPIPVHIAPMSNSQSRSLHIGAVNVSSNASNPKDVSDEILLSLSEQLKQSNANFDSPVVV